MKVDKFAEELNWCIKQLELGLQRQSPDSRQTQESLKILKVLRSTKAPMVKKRQAMRSALGDYRKKMKDEEKKSLNAMKHSKFKSTHNTRFFGKSKFIRQSHRKEVVQEHEQEENRLLSINLGGLNLHQASSSSTLPSLQTESSSSSQNQSINGHINSNSDGQLPLPSASGDDARFKFFPSDNSFTFSFNDGIAAQEVKKDSKTSQSADNLDGDKCPSNTNNSAIETFKYEKSDNSFSFNFNA